jgi:hypothetical protein
MFFMAQVLTTQKAQFLSFLVSILRVCNKISLIQLDPKK